MNIVQVSVDNIEQHPENARVGDVAAIVESIQTNGFYGAVVVQESTGYIIVGNHRYLAAREVGMTEVPVIYMDIDDDRARRIMLADNRTTDVASYDDRSLVELLQSVPDLTGTGYDDTDLADLLASVPSSAPPVDGPGGPLPDDPLAGDTPDAPIGGTLADRFLAPPFSVLDTRQGYWRARKQQWLSLGIKSEVGRASNLLQMSDSILLADKGVDPWKFKAEEQPNYSSPANISGNTPAFFYKKREMENVAGRELTSSEAAEVFQTGKLTTVSGEVVDFDIGDIWSGAGTSVFDPVLCEIAYRWWCPPEGRVVDPFAGGSVRGIVAAKLGYSYFGVELRDEQVEANREQLTDIAPEASDRIVWQQGDSTNPENWADAGTADMVFTCPPYFDLEVYSEEPNDLSNVETDDEFFALLEEAFGNADRVLADNRFAVVVMGEVREDRGPLRDMIGRTVDAARQVGWDYYNDAILLTAVGSLALRAGRIFQGGRKLARCHQYVMVFVKGDWKKAHEACGDLTDVVIDLEAEL